MQKILRYNSSLHVYFDRDIRFEVGEGLCADIVLLPRFVTSRCNEEHSYDSRLINKQSIKLTLVKRFINNIGRDEVQITTQDKFLNTDDKSESYNV